MVAEDHRDLAVILVTWNVRNLALDALRTLSADLALSGLSSEVWVVDNASRDNTVEAINAAFPNVHLIASDKNLGFAAANNVALRKLGFKDSPAPAPGAPTAVFLLNPDTRVIPGTIRALWETLQNKPDAGIVGARLENADGSFQHGSFGIPGLAQLVIDLFPLDWIPRRIFGRLYESRINGRYSRKLYNAGEAFPVGHTLGATMFMRRSAIEQTGLFDEQFFMYVEEVDWSMRIRAAGWNIYCQPQARVVHLVGQSAQQIRSESLINLWRSRLRLYDKHYGPVKRKIARWLVRYGIQRRLASLNKLPADQRESARAAYQTIAGLVTTRNGN